MAEAGRRSGGGSAPKLHAGTKEKNLYRKGQKQLYRGVKHKIGL